MYYLVTPSMGRLIVDIMQYHTLICVTYSDRINKLKYNFFCMRIYSYYNVTAVVYKVNMLTMLNT
jgi:hypothetical protein